MSAPFELPKGLLRYLLERLLPSGLKGEAIRGDLLEEFRAIAERSSLRQARTWYRRQAVSVLWAVAWGRISRVDRGPVLGISWLDFKLGFRILIRYPGLTLVSVLAMAITVTGAAGFLAFTNNVVSPTLPLDAGDRVVAVQNWNVATS